MYERFYGFKERPFSLLPDPDFLYLGDKHRTALDLLELTVFNQAGFCVVSGEIGAGKTTLIRELLNRLDDDICVGLISNTHPSFGELLQWIVAAFGLASDCVDKFELHKRFLDFVIQQYADKKRTLLIIDEAQNLSTAALEELRMLSNVNSDKDLVLQVILVGQNQLRDKLQAPELQQFAQRIAVDHHLTGLNEKETHDYIQYRLSRAGGSADLFSEDACRTVYRCSDGIPRLINGICDTCLVYGYSDKSRMITPELVREVVSDQHSGKVGTLAGKVLQQADDVDRTTVGSTRTGSASFSGYKGATPPAPEAVSVRADTPASQIPDSRERIAPLEGRGSEDADPPTEVSAGQALAAPPASTILGSMRTTLLQEAVKSKAADLPQDTVTGNDSAELSSFTRLAVEAEQSDGSVDKQHSPTVFRLLMGLVLLMGLGVTGWLTWLVWDAPPVAGTVAGRSSESVAASTTRIGEPATAPQNAVAADPLTQENPNTPAEQRKAERLVQERREAEKQLAEQREAERLAQERREAEKQLAEQREAERLAQERREAEKQLAEQREAERLAQERREAEKQLAEQREAERLARERREAEKQLAEQREAERLARERQQAKKRLAEQRKAERLARERREAEKRLADQRKAELEAKRAAALAAWKKANSGIGWAEEVEDDDESD